MTPRPDVRLDDGPMVPVTCETCGVAVEARKSSWEQTSIQWHQGWADQCLERRAFHAVPGVNGGAFRGCTALVDSVRRAASAGLVPVQDATPLRVRTPDDASALAPPGDGWSGAAERSTSP